MVLNQERELPPQTHEEDEHGVAEERISRICRERPKFEEKSIPLSIPVLVLSLVP